MPKYRGVCKVCGKSYAVCMSPQNRDRFNWKVVACSPQCGEEYFRRVDEARNPKPKAEEVKPKKAAKVKAEEANVAPVVDDPKAEIETFFDV